MPTMAPAGSRHLDVQEYSAAVHARADLDDQHGPLSGDDGEAADSSKVSGPMAQEPALHAAHSPSKAPAQPVDATRASRDGGRIPTSGDDGEPATSVAQHTNVGGGRTCGALLLPPRQSLSLPSYRWVPGGLECAGSGELAGRPATFVGLANFFPDRPVPGRGADANPYEPLTSHSARALVEEAKRPPPAARSEAERRANMTAWNTTIGLLRG